MTDVLLKVMPGKLLKPMYSGDEAIVGKWALGDTVIATVKRPRNPGFHRKFWALLNTAFEAQDRFPNLESLRFYVTVKAGYFDAIETRKGTMIVPRSISFAAMGADDFETLYDTAIDVLLRDVLPERWTGEELRAMTETIAEFA